MSFMDARPYWDERILPWESARYSGWAAANPFAWTVRNRARIAEALLKQEIASISAATVLELGCGSGILAEKLRQLPLRSYLGLDISPIAIQKARTRFQDPRFTFEISEAAERGRLEADVVFFLGLTDWLPPGGLEALLSSIRAKTVLFSFTHSRSGFSLPFYHAYHRWIRGNQPREFPRSFPEDHVSGLCAAVSWTPVRLMSWGKLDPGRIVVLKRADERTQ